MINGNEKEIITKFICTGDNVIDVGGNHAEWSKAVIDHAKSVNLEIYEANPSLIPELEKVKELNANTKIINYALSDSNKCNLDFWIYNIDGMSGLSRRWESEEIKFSLGIPHKITVNSCTLDSMHIEEDHISFIKIDTEGNELPILKGMKKMLENNQFKTIQIEYGKCWEENSHHLKDAFELLKDFKFIYKLPENSDIIKVDSWNDDMEDYQYSNFIFSKQELI